MAMYEYHCDDCHAVFTVSEPISEHAKEARKKGKRKGRKCPQCEGTNTRQLFSSFYAKTSSKS